MRRIRFVIGAIVSLVSVIPLVAQQAGKIAEIHFNRIKPNMVQQYENGRKKHMAWHKNQKDAWSWYTWQITTGDNTGNYVVGSFGHEWKDFDARGDRFVQADSADALMNMGASLASEDESYYTLRPDMSLNPESNPPSPLITVSHFMLNPEGINDFIEGVKKVNEGIKKTNFPLSGPSRWYQLVNGGQGPHFVLVGDRANWAAFQSPTDKTLDMMMEEAYGKDQGAAILTSLRKAMHSSFSEALTYRPDLSYIAGK